MPNLNEIWEPDIAGDEHQEWANQREFLMRDRWYSRARRGLSDVLADATVSMLRLREAFAGLDKTEAMQRARAGADSARFRSAR